MSDTNERSVGSDGSVVAWAVVCGDCVDSMFTDRDKAVEWACKLIPPWQIVPLYRAPTLTDAEREANPAAIPKGSIAHDGSPEPTAHLPDTVHAGCRNRESDAGAGDIVGRWIPVTERLPDNGVAVLVGIGGFVNYAMRRGSEWFIPAARTGVWVYAHNERVATTGMADISSYAHWMPLPSPPNGAK